MYPVKIEEDYITKNLLSTKEKLPDYIRNMNYQQISLFDDVRFRTENISMGGGM